MKGRKKWLIAGATVVAIALPLVAPRHIAAPAQAALAALLDALAEPDDGPEVDRPSGS